MSNNKTSSVVGTSSFVDFQLHDATTTVKEPTEEPSNNSSNYIIDSMKKASGIGDTPDLISDEAPPLAILEFAESDTLLLETGTTSSAPTRGEETEIVVNPPGSSVDESFSVEKPISVQNEASPQGNAALPITATESCECKTAFSPLPPSTSPAVHSTMLNDNTSTYSSIFSSRQTQMITSADTQNPENFSQLAQQEHGNDAPEKSLTPSLTDIGTHSGTTHRVSIKAHVPEHFIIFEDNEPSTVSITTASYSNTTHGQLESGAVTAPEVERQVKADNDIGDKSVSTTDSITKSINMDESYDVGGLLSQQRQQQQQQQQLEDVKSASENEDYSDSAAPPEATDMKCISSSQPSSSPRGKDLSSAITRSRKVEKEKTRSKSKRKQSNSSAPRNSGKSPIRVVEVYDRTTPVSIKATKSSKPLSPYQCKVFPIRENIRPGQSSSFTVSPKQCEVLNKELARGLEKEKHLLVEAFTEYFKNGEKTSASSPSSYTPDVENDLIISNGSERETLMSWLIKGKHRESVEGGENNENMPWHPSFNIIRKSACTQVSSPPSFTEKSQAVVSNQDIINSTQKQTNPFSKIRLVGHKTDADILNTGKTMYKSLKSLQKAIHLSDIFCFRTNAPDSPLGESLSQPKFQQFMESENEIEILENIVSLLVSTKDDVELYLHSLQNAHLGTGNDAIKLGKIEVGNNNELNEEDNNDDKNEKGDGTRIDPDVEFNQQQQQIVPFTCPSCHSQMDLEITHPTQAEISRERLLPQVFTFLEQHGKVAFSTYYTVESKSLVHTTLCDGHIYHTQFSATDSSGPLQGITKAKKEYLGKPSHLSIEILLSTIHRCASYIDTRVACSCVWSRQSKHYLFELIESYLEKEYIPSTNMSKWKLYKMNKKLKKINVFAGVVRSFSEELVAAVDKIHFCMQKSRLLLSKNLNEPELPGFSSVDSTNSSWDDIKSSFSSTHIYITPQCSQQKNCEMNMTSSVERLYAKLRNEAEENDKTTTGENEVSLMVLMQILAFAANDIESTSVLAEHYAKALRIPGKKARRVLKFLSITLSQMGLSKDVQFGSLLATFLTVVDKLSIFEEFMCEQKFEIRARIHKMCLKIIRKLIDLRRNLCVQTSWSTNLAKKSLMRIREINEIKRIKTQKKTDRHMNTEIEFLGGSDGSLRAAIC